MALDKNAITKEAQKFASKGQFDKAIAEWKKLLKETPKDPNIYNTIGDLCLKKDAKPEAVDAYRRAADLLAEDGFTSKAIALYKKIINIDPKKLEVHLSLGDLNAEKGLTGNALESYKVVADHYQKNKEMGKALGIYQKMADLSPGNVTFRTKLADMYAKEGMKKEAVQAYLAAATAHIGGNAFKEARQMFEKVLALDPNNMEVYHKAGVVYFKEGKFAEACKAFKPAFENDPSNTEVADFYLEALTKAGREQDAAEIYEKVLEQDPSRIDLREKLFRLHLAKPDIEKALGEARKLAEEQVKSLLAAAAETGHKLLPGAVLPGAEQETEAEKALKIFIDGHPDFADARRTLSEFYEKVGRKEEAARELVKAAGVLIAGGDRAGAKDALNRALNIWPGLDEAQQQLEQLEAATAAPPPPAEAPVSGPTAPAAPAQPVVEENPKIAEGLTEADVLVKYGLAAKAVEQLEALAKRFPESLKLRVRMRDLYREQGNAKKASEHSLLAADICGKSGQQGQAESLLREALEIDPKNAEVLSRLGMAPAAPEEMPAPAGVLGDLPAFDEPVIPSDAEQPAPAEEEQAVSPDFGEALTFEEPVLFGAQPEAAPEEAPDEVPEYNETPSALEIPEEPAAPEAPEEPVIPNAPSRELEEPVRELAATALEGKVDIGEVWSEAEFYYHQGLFDEARKKYEMILEQKPDDRRSLKRIKEISRQKEEVQEFANLAEAVEGLESFVPGGELATEELASSASDEEAVRSLMQEIHSMKLQEREQEARQRVEQEARERAEQEARERAEQEAWQQRERERREREEQEDRQRAEQEARERGRELERELREKLVRAAKERQERERQAAAAQTAAEEIIAPDEEILQPAFHRPAESERPAFARPPAEEDFSDLGVELRDAEEDFAGLGARLAEAAPAGEGTSDDFFDLAAELRDELSGISVPERTAASAEEQSLDEIFEDFKKGVEQQESKQDVDTHYNLGIAYKEMGLLDDAIDEFLMTSEGEQKFVESRYMLGLCYMEQGEYYKAIAEIHNALNYTVSFGGSQEEQISMHYDLGLAYQGAGNIPEAISEFQRVSEMDPEYRDVQTKLRELQAGEFISLEQLKEDIEKEISSKFLEEGERIEREEKTRKNDKVRN
jgi:tetratricopeptide (TPR) repeat protein